MSDYSTFAQANPGTDYPVKDALMRAQLTLDTDKVDSAATGYAFGYKRNTTTGLTYGYYGGVFIDGGAIVTIADGTVALSAGSTNYVERTKAGVVSKNTVGFTAGSIPMATVVTGGAAITGVTDKRQDNVFGDLKVLGGTNLTHGIFRKSDPTTVAFVKTAAFAISSQAAALYIEVNGTMQTIAPSTAVTMPGSPAAGTDYAIWAKTDGTLECTSNHVTPPTANARRIGGFHYAPGGNATGVAGGDTTPAINAYSIWDLKFRPACPDPRGMTLVADGFWADIYLLGVDHPTNGSSKYNVTIADGSSPPKIPAKFGGNGSTAYGGGNWWDMGETLRSFGKRHPTYDEFAALAYGTTEAASATAATDPVSTILRAESTSKWGVMLSTGNLYVWGANLGGPYNTTAAWQANTGGRGSTYNLPNAVLLGGTWADGVNAGSRSSNWNNAPSHSHYTIGARGVCDHLQLD